MCLHKASYLKFCDVNILKLMSEFQNVPPKFQTVLSSAALLLHLIFTRYKTSVSLLQIN